MFHILLHLAVPVALAVARYRPDHVRAAVWMLATMAIDLDHLLADPIYDPERCSIGFHPLHTWPVVVGVVALLVGVWAMRRRSEDDGPGPRGWWTLEVVSIGVLIHMALDAADCVL